MNGSGPGPLYVPHSPIRAVLPGTDPTAETSRALGSTAKQQPRAQQGEYLMKEAAKVLGALVMTGVILAVGAYVVLLPYLGGA